MRYCNPQFNVVVAIKWKLYLTWPPSKERVTVDVELASLPFPARAAESIDRRTDPNVDESELFQHFLPGCARQTTGNSGRPKVNVSDRRFGHWLAVRNVSELQSSARAQNAINLRKDRPFVGTKIHHTIADDDVRPSVFDPQILRQTVFELDVAQAQFRRR
jgi:hypothetical protein